MGKSEHSKLGKHKYCRYSGELTTNKEVILTKYAVQYVRKMGYLVTNFRIGNKENEK